MTLRRWESWVVFTRGDGIVKEKCIRKHLTRRGAESWAKRITYSPSVLANTLRVGPDERGRLLFANPDVRRVT